MLYLNVIRKMLTRVVFGSKGDAPITIGRPDSRPYRIEVGILFLFALSLRFAYAWKAGLLENPAGTLGEEVTLAYHLKSGRGYVTPYFDYKSPGPVLHASAHSPPGYPYLLSTILGLGGRFFAEDTGPQLIALTLGAIAGSLIAPVLGLAVAVHKGIRAFWIAGLLAACWPILVSNSPLLWDTPYSLLFLAIFLYISVSSPSPQPGGFALLGAFGGIAALFHPMTLVPCGMTCLVLAARVRPFYRSILSVCCCGLCLFAVILPWSLRNFHEFGRFVPIRNNFPLELWIGNQFDVDGTTLTACRLRHPLENSEELARMCEMGDDRYMQARQADADTWIRENPEVFARLTRTRVVLFWLGNVWLKESLLGRELPRLGGVGMLRLSFNLLPIIFGFAGLFLWRNKSAVLFTVACLLILPIPYYITHVSPNYRVYVIVLMVIPASITLEALVGLFPRPSLRMFGNPFRGRVPR